jgi:hypothetical protein
MRAAYHARLERLWRSSARLYERLARRDTRLAPQARRAAAEVAARAEHHAELKRKYLRAMSEREGTAPPDPPAKP